MFSILRIYQSGQVSSVLFSIMYVALLNFYLFQILWYLSFPIIVANLFSFQFFQLLTYVVWGYVIKVCVVTIYVSSGQLIFIFKYTLSYIITAETYLFRLVFTWCIFSIIYFYVITNITLYFKCCWLKGYTGFFFLLIRIINTFTFIVFTDIFGFTFNKSFCFFYLIQ